MEMCYDGVLVMPSSYVVMDQDEMMYMEGGISWSTIASIANGIISVVGKVNTVMTAFSNAIKLGKAIKGIAKSTFLKGVAAKTSAAIGKITAWISSHTGQLVIAAVATLLAVGAGYYVGYTVASKTYAKYGK